MSKKIDENAVHIWTILIKTNEWTLFAKAEFALQFDQLENIYSIQKSFEFWM